MYFDGDNVTFNDSNNNNYTVNITGGPSGNVVKPTSILVNTAAPHAYTFTGGAIPGTTGLTKQGTGTLVLNNSNNTNTGLTSIQNGTLQVGNGSTFSYSAPFASISLGDGATNGGVLDLNGNTVNVSSLVASGSGNNVVANSNGGSATLNYNGGTSTFAGAIQDNVSSGSGSGGTSLSLSTGTLVLTGANTYSGQTNIATGSTLQVGTGTPGSIPHPPGHPDSGTPIFNANTPSTIALNISGGAHFSKTVPAPSPPHRLQHLRAHTTIGRRLHSANRQRNYHRHTRQRVPSPTAAMLVSRYHSDNLTPKRNRRRISGNGGVQQIGSGTSRHSMRCQHLHRAYHHHIRQRSIVLTSRFTGRYATGGCGCDHQRWKPWI